MSILETRRSINLLLQEAPNFVTGVPRAALEPLVRAFLKHTDDRYLHSRSPTDLLALFASLRTFISQRPGDEIRVRVFNPSLEVHGYCLDATVVETCMKDQPFLLDTLRVLFASLGLQELECLHPILELERDGTGRLVRLGRDGEGSGWLESCMHFELSRMDDPEKLERLRLEILERLQAAQTVVHDHREMVESVARIEQRLAGLCGDERGEKEGREAVEFLRWLRDDHFIFFGEEHFEPTPENPLELVPSTRDALGLRRGVARTFDSVLPGGAGSFAGGDALLHIGKGTELARIHRSGIVDTVLVRDVGPGGQRSGFWVLSGLLTARAIRQKGSSIPVLKRRLARLLRAEEAVPGSYHHQCLTSAFDALPVEFLFQAEETTLQEAVHRLMEADRREDTNVWALRSAEGRSAFVLISMPRKHYDEALRERMRQHLLERTGAHYIDHRVEYGDLRNVVCAFFLTRALPLEGTEELALEHSLLEIARPWEERFEALMAADMPGGGEAAVARWLTALPERTIIESSPEEAVRDVLQLEAALKNGLQFRLTRDGEPADSEIVRLKVYRVENIYLTDSLPVLHNFGLQVADQQSTRIQIEPRAAYIDLFRIVEVRGRPGLDLLSRERDLAEGLQAVLTARADDDALNRLILLADLNHRQVQVLRATLAYAQQLYGVPVEAMRATWLNHPKVARLLIELFEARFDPCLGDAGSEARTRLCEAIGQRLEEVLRTVETQAEDRTLRIALRLVNATLRTNFFRTPCRDHLSFKVDSRRVLDRSSSLDPIREIFVHHVAVEGIHLRGGMIARGGLRWSDRHGDYRSEVLSLMRTQMVKNVLIVPVGAKGGFVLKRRPETREEERALADEMYKIFIEGLLDLTDNRVADRIAPPEQVVRWDQDDPYLVVAADKGTAHLSDAANTIALARGFWLGDAFASGGSNGYDHKKEAITARGGWECVKRHFWELGLDPEQDPITCVGIGDMSGDVFGNGLLLSRSLKLLGAFNHLHIFLDPDPDPHQSFEERQRLFALPRSSWDDYRREVLSPGGGIFRRSARSIPLSPQVQRMLDIQEATLSGEALIQRLLTLPVDLLWNGGIGTYVKASSESHADVRDHINNPVRVDASQVRARVIGEGGNLGLTQAARVELAARGLRLNTDAVDNSGGVDMSDHEVNLKILLAPLVASGQLEGAERDRLLRRMTQEVAEAVLQNNLRQSVMLSLDERRSREDLRSFEYLLQELTEVLELDLVQECLPDAAALAVRRKERRGLVRPELARLAPLTKMRVKRALLEDSRIDGPFVERFLLAYFPPAIRTGFAEAARRHSLRREILATALTSYIVDFAGTTYFQELFEDTGHTVGAAAMAYLVSSELLGADALKRTILEPESGLPAEAQYELLIEVERALAAYGRRMLARGLDVFEPERVIARLAPDLRQLQDELPYALPERVRELYQGDLARYQALGLSPLLARRVVTFGYVVSATDLALIHAESDLTLTQVATLFHAIGEECGIRRVFERLELEGVDERWSRQALMVQADRLMELQFKLARQAAGGASHRSVEARLRGLIESRRPALERIRSVEARLGVGEALTVASFSVLAESLKGLLEP